MIYLLLILLLSGCATDKPVEPPIQPPPIEIPTPDCCYGTKIPEGKTCKDQTMDCIGIECVHYAHCGWDSLINEIQ